MKISGPLRQPLRLCSHGEQPISHLCRHFVNMGSAVESPLTGEPQLWWTRFGANFATDILPDQHLVATEEINLSDAIHGEDAHINPPESRVELLRTDCMFEEQNEQKHRLTQVDVSFSDGQCLVDRSETLQKHSIQTNGGTTVEDPANHGCLSSDRELHPGTALVTTEYDGGNHLSEETQTPKAPASARVKVMCSYGGRIMPRPVDGKLRYVGGETRIISVHKHISFSDFMSMMAQVYGTPLGLKYQLPDEDLDALVSVSSDDDLQNMMEEYDKVASCGLSSRLRLFFFSNPAEIEVSEMKTEGEEGCAFSDQRYVDAINGVSGKLHVTLLEDDVGVTHPADEGCIVEGNGRMPLSEHANELSQSKSASAPSSSPSSPSVASHQVPPHNKPPALADFSLQILNDRLSKVEMAPHILEGDGGGEHEGPAIFSSTPFFRHNDQHQYDRQFSLPADSQQQVLHHELLGSRGESLSDLRHSDSLNDLHRQSEIYLEYRTNAGGHTDHWHDMQLSREIVSPHGERQRIFQQLKQSACPQQPPPAAHHHHQQQHHQQLVYHHHHHHQQQPIQQPHQAWYPQHDGDPGRADQAHHDMHKPQQVIHQPQPPHHSHHNPTHDWSQWNADFLGHSTEHNAVPPFIHGSSQINPQILHGLAPAPPYQIGSAPASPRVGLYDFQGKCSCGLQHSQVHRGITVSIGEQSHNRWPPHYADRKQGFRNSPRFYDGASHTADLPMWQQASHTVFVPESEHRDGGSRWQHYTGRHPRDLHLADCQTRSRGLQYSEYPVHEGDFLPSHERPDMNMRCLCINCTENRRQPVEMTVGLSAYSDLPDMAPEWLSHRKGLDSDAGRLLPARKPLPRVPVYREEDQKGDHVDDRFTEGESGLFAPQLPGDSESRRTMGSHVDGVHYGRKIRYPLGVLPNKSPTFDEPPIHQLSEQHDWYPSPKAFVELPGNRSEVQFHPHKQNSTRLVETGNTSLGQEISRMSLASTSPVMMEDIDSSSRVALHSDSEPHNYDGALAPQSFCGEEGCMPGAAGEVVTPLQSFATSGLQFEDVNCNGSKIAAGRGDNRLLSPDVIPLGHVSSASVASQAGQAVSASVPVAGNMQQAPIAPICDQSTFTSGNVIKFSFAGPPDNTKLSLCEANTGNKPVPSSAPAMELLAQGTIPPMLEGHSDKELSHKIPKVIEEVADTDSQKGLQGLVISGDMTSSNTVKNPPVEQEKVSVLDDVIVDNGHAEAITEKMIHTVQNGEVTNTSHQERDSEAGVLGMEDCNKPSLSEAEAEAISRGLQIIKNCDLEDLKELGSGTYGTVYHGKWRGSDVAIKRIKASCFNGPPSERERLISDFWREACMLGQLHHPNVVAFYGAVPDGPGGTLATVTEYMVNGSLKQVLHKKDRTIDRRKRLFIAMDAAFGMEYLHSKNIVHFDLKCENLLVNMRDAHRPICKVGDFGLSKVKHQTLVSGGVRGTLPWMAPELLSGNCNMVSEKIDVFSFGIVMWELLTGEEPYENMHCGAIIGGIVNNTLRPSIPSWCDPGWRSLMERCWSGSPADRPAFTEVAKGLRAIAATMNLK